MSQFMMSQRGPASAPPPSPWFSTAVPAGFRKNTRQRVRQAAQELGFRSAAPRPLVGILLPDISNLFFSSIGQAFLLEARAQGNDAIVMVHGDQPGQDLANLDTLLSRGVGEW